MSVEATLIVFFASQKLHQVRHFATLSQSGRRYLWATAPVTYCTNSWWLTLRRYLEYIIVGMFVWQLYCAYMATYLFWYPLLFTISPVASSWKNHQRSKWWWSQGKGSGWGCLRIIDMYVTYIYIYKYIYIHVHTYMYIQYTHIYSGFRRINQNNISNAIYKDMLLLQGHVAFETQIFIKDEHIQTTYIKIHKWSCAHNCLFTYMQSTPASTESFVCRVIGSLKSVPLRCLTNRATGKSASNQATMVQHVNTAQNGHDLQQLPKHSVCVTVRQASILHSYLIHITVTVDSYQIRNRYILRSYWIQIRHLLIHITVDKFKLDSSYSSFPFILDW